MKVKPLGDRILVLPKTSEGVSKGGIVIPDTAQEKTTQGVVIAIGDDKEHMRVKVKDNVMYAEFSGTTITINGKDHLLIKMEDILAVLE